MTKTDREVFEEAESPHVRPVPPGARNADSGRKAGDALPNKGAKVAFLQLDVSG